MKYLFPLFALTVITLFSSCGASKELTAEAQAAQSSLEACQSELNTTQQELAQAKSMLGGNGEQLNQLQAENRALRDQLNNSQAQLATVTQQMQATSDNYGVWYRVQIGAYEQSKIDKDLETTDQLALEKGGDLQKIALGRFRNYDDAKKLQTQLQNKGLKDAWVVSYKDGVRVPIEEVKN
jgi:septal ring factor EnvC (AmiA/AmiB activator)